MTIGSRQARRDRQHAKSERRRPVAERFDMARLVLLPTYQVSSNIIFNAEIEFEHAGSGFDNDDKLHGTAEVEQAFFDFKINDYFNFRAPGVDIVPISFNNLYHEPTLFYSVQRPELANGLIPTTWVAPSTGFYGKIIDGLNYQFQLSQSTWRISATILRIAAPTGPQSPGATRRGSMA
jgi:Phosphate-selective porin O and P